MSDPGELPAEVHARLARFRAALSGVLDSSRARASEITEGLVEQRRQLEDLGRDHAARTEQLAARLREIGERARRTGCRPAHPPGGAASEPSRSPIEAETSRRGWLG